MKKYISSEYVGIGHPDKIADQISDTILDKFLSVNPKSRVAVETLVSDNKVIVAGEVNSDITISDDDLKEEIIKTVSRIGYKKDIPCTFREDNLDISIFLRQQSPNIQESVDKSNGTIGAGDQGIMFGYATSEESAFYLPMPYVLAAELLITLNFKINTGELDGIYTDNKSQVCCVYDNDRIYIDKIILSTFHNKKLNVNDVRKILKQKVIDDVLKGYERFILKDHDIKFLINSAGPFWVGGPEADTGLTGRKIIADTYGGFAPHGGGAFSGKDPSKVDRSATYMARHIAKNLVANGYCNHATVQLSYAIGDTQPFSISVSSDQVNIDKSLEQKIFETFDLSPQGIINYLELTNPLRVKYKTISSGGHFFGLNTPWEKIISF
ncbi:MAG TPA: methionine adenosyltransferase [bacterium]|nr:MAG: S-adenosylmethionine synthase [Bacteroidetes bacterium ADurb.Bin028]HOG38264.1 methionine adenosyltransferase [bacterium]